ncbi:MAG: hypothetical protein LBS33_05375 [Streptococcaceae bacterium]|jgi:hypothetical protein|nr:hypothetical protein [Streptococcaceae bacterium]
MFGILKVRAKAGILLIVLVLYSFFFMTLGLIQQSLIREIEFLKIQLLVEKADVLAAMTKRYLKEQEIKSQGQLNFNNGYVKYQFSDEGMEKLTLEVYPDDNYPEKMFKR